jgi:hypothetical protein
MDGDVLMFAQVMTVIVLFSGVVRCDLGRATSSSRRRAGGRFTGDVCEAGEHSTLVP